MSIIPKKITIEELNAMLQDSQEDVESRGIEQSDKKKRLTFDDPEDVVEEHIVKVVNTVFNKIYNSMSAEKFKSLIELIVNENTYIKNDFVYVLISTGFYDTKIEKYLPEEKPIEAPKKGRTTKSAPKRNAKQNTIAPSIIATQPKYLERTVKNNLLEEKVFTDLDSSDFLKYDLCYNIMDQYRKSITESFNCVTEKTRESVVVEDDVEDDEHKEEDEDIFIRVDTYALIPIISVKSVLESYGKKILALREQLPLKVQKPIYWGDSRKLKITKDDPMVNAMGKVKITEKQSSVIKRCTMDFTFAKKLQPHQQLIIDHILQEIYGYQKNEDLCKEYLAECPNDVTIAEPKKKKDVNGVMQESKVFQIFTSECLGHNITRNFKMKPSDRFIIEMKTGTGKTITALKLITILGLKTLIIVKSEDLKSQWQHQIISNIRCDDDEIQEKSMFTKGNIKAMCNDIYIGVINSVSLYSDQIKHFDLVIIDECHCVGAKSFLTMLKNTQDVRYVIGLSATPERNDNRQEIYYNFFNGKYTCHLNTVPSIRFSFYGFADYDCKKNDFYGRPIGKDRMDKVRHEIFSGMCLVENRTKMLLQLVQSVMQKTNQWNRPRESDKINGEMQDEEPTGEALVAATNKKILIFCKNIDYITMFKERLEQAYGKNNIASIHGSINTYTNQKIIIGTYGKCSEGLDIKGLNTLILAQPPFSGEQSLTQICGRIGRINEDDKDAVMPQIIEVVDNTFFYHIENRINIYRKIYAKSCKKFDFSFRLHGTETQLKKIKNDTQIHIGSKKTVLKLKDCTWEQFRTVMQAYPTYQTC